VYIDDNLRTVEPGRFYRSGQMPDTRLGETIRRHDVKTVINLRGENPDEAWYRNEVAVCEALGVAHHSFKWSKNRLPDPESLAEFVGLCNDAQSPILVHCQGGTHRSGVASAIYQLLEGRDIATARGEFHLFFNDAPIGQVLDLYEGSKLPFDEWVLREYPSLYETAH
jgi:protein tyrosine/serine phosphatase